MSPMSLVLAWHYIYICLWNLILIYCTVQKLYSCTVYRRYIASFPVNNFCAHELPDNSTQVDRKLWHDMNYTVVVFWIQYSITMYQYSVPKITRLCPRRWNTLGRLGNWIHKIYTSTYIYRAGRSDLGAPLLPTVFIFTTYISTSVRCNDSEDNLTSRS